jgi:NAD(P)-dependent dehydrogenase (short-subunit alcohol dehydrogenase family)
MKKSVVITGVSTGIGRATAKILLQNGFRVFGSVRRSVDAEALGAEFGENFVPLIFDICDEKAVRQGAEIVAQHLEGKMLNGLVNNAGTTIAGPFAYLPVDCFRRQLEINLVGAFNVTQSFLPHLGFGRKPSGVQARIVNIGSVSGRFAAPFVGAYNVSKFGLEGFSETLRRELLMFGIDVIQIDPGPVKTPIWDKGERRLLVDFPDTVYNNALKRFHALANNEAEHGFEPEVIGRLILKVLTTARPKTRYLIMPNKLINYTIPSRFPPRLLDWIMAKVMHLRV